MALRVLIAAVGISAVLGIYALLRQDLDEWSAKTLGTTLLVSAASLLIMANAAGLEKRSVGYFLITGVGLLAALVALPVFLYALWFEVDDDGLWKTAGLPEDHLGLRGPLIVAIAAPFIYSSFSSIIIPIWDGIDLSDAPDSTSFAGLARISRARFCDQSRSCHYRGQQLRSGTRCRRVLRLLPRSNGILGSQIQSAVR